MASRMGTNDEKKTKSPIWAKVGTALKKISAGASMAAAKKMRKRETAASHQWVRTDTWQCNARHAQATAAASDQNDQSR